MAEHCVNLVASAAIPNAMTIEEVKRETAKDIILQAVINLVRSNKWYDTTQHQGTDVDQAALSNYSRVRDTLTVNKSGYLVMRDYRIVVPRTLQHRVVELAHEGHQGICKTKALLRTKVWFPGVDTAAEEAVKRCIPCQANTTRRETEPLSISKERLIIMCAF